MPFTIDVFARVGAFVFGYLMGSIPFGVLLTGLAGTQDLRSLGSGNIGATNVLRTGRKDLAFATLVLDAGKGVVAVVVARHFGIDSAVLAGLGAFLGHLFPVWLNFRGGKGVATYLGCLIALAWQGALAFVAIWIAVAALWRYSSAAALAASLATPPLLLLLGFPNKAALFAALTALLWIMHRANIARLVAGTEGKIGRLA
jgi:glycerol-3-phosphate acyltransferase PlsY